MEILLHRVLYINYIIIIYLIYSYICISSLQRDRKLNIANNQLGMKSM